MNIIEQIALAFAKLAKDVDKVISDSIVDNIKIVPISGNLEEFGKQNN